MQVKDHYEKLGKKALEIQNESLADEDLLLLSTNHAFLHDFAEWLDILKDRPEINILQNAIKEYQIGIFSNSLGLYQQAFMGLRFFLERTLVAILFSANEIELNLWKIGERDTYWNELLDKDKGIFSHKFCKAFFPELKDELNHFNVITSKVYRECSEYVHGNKTVIDKIPNSFEYSKELFHEWNSKADIIRRVILFTLCLRYLKHLKPEDVKKIENTITDEFKGITQIIELIN
ncbi:hypothetical protein H3Z85_19200 [Chryseobacterium indologenes]|uniref:hypothetical protein n=1 Tax=Chryseobacterium indologenes TaxID=253 RepID=UPI0003E07DA4|nr:hypothetical protein [Chryseobacterium indologenes]QPQ51392.1 hypothetical protein H3Z85_19200 [Chryseobacterium indologenes]GAE65291.1 hypothetical protein CIN01S_10_03090 [Chryseobacterium indologenes NBRC 14944]SFI90621.1 hypothetical protein SAMN05421692_0982 [Chryseobacterium indologenes]SUX49819.1 Uncharacterised protein [Chryseobacterium indologenes]